MLNTSAPLLMICLTAILADHSSRQQVGSMAVIGTTCAWLVSMLLSATPAAASTSAVQEHGVGAGCPVHAMHAG